MIGIGVLSGGKSRRMGKSKSKLDYFGHTFLERQLKLWKDYPVYLSVAKKNDFIEYTNSHTTVLEDRYPSSGPVGGIFEILDHSEYEWNFITAIDLPYLKQELPQLLELFVEDQYDCVIFTSNNQLHPLCGLYRKSLKYEFNDALEKGNLKLISLIKGFKTKYIPIEKTGFNEKVLMNVNNLSEYLKLFGKGICICGAKNSGKSTFINKVIEKLTEKKIKVSVLKHDGHDFQIDHKGTDTYNYRQSGAEEVIIYNNHKMAYIDYNFKGYDYRDILNRENTKYDILIIEGLKSEPLPKFEIIRKGISTELISNPINRLGVISDFDYKGEDRSFDLNNPEEFAEYLFELFIDKE